ncbi:MAG: hypothetical protein ACRDB2_07360, partial [Fusobacteriaceae bacterium]
MRALFRSHFFYVQLFFLLIKRKIKIFLVNRTNIFILNIWGDFMKKLALIGCSLAFLVACGEKQGGETGKNK